MENKKIKFIPCLILKKNPLIERFNRTLLEKLEKLEKQQTINGNQSGFILSNQ